MEYVERIVEIAHDHPDSFFMGTCAVLCVSIGSYFAGTGRGPPQDVLTETRVKMYPYIAAASLTTLSVMLEKLGPARVNFFLMFYFGLAGANSLWFLLRAFIPLRGPKLFMYPKSHTILTEFILPSRPIPFFLGDILLYGIAISLNVIYYKTYSNTVNNIIAMSIATCAVMTIRIERFTAAAPMLWGLLIYDVFFVYSTDVMTSVAANLRGPVKLLYTKNGGESVLGLGDIVIPGLFLSVCSRFDAFLYKVLGRRTPYWLVGMIGYTCALIVTDVVCFITREGQPALLFITPAVTVPVIALALYRKEHFAFMSFSG